MNKTILTLVISSLLFSVNAKAEGAKTSVFVLPAPINNGRQMISLNFKDTEIREVLKYIANFAHMKILIESQIKGKISIVLNNVSWQEALKQVIKIQKLRKKINNGLITIYIVKEADKIANESKPVLQLKDEVSTEERAAVTKPAAAPPPQRGLKRMRGMGGIILKPSSLMGFMSFDSVPENREKYQEIKNSGIKLVTKDPVSTFSIDVDTGSYSNVRRLIQAGKLPPKDAVRIEEMINYFNYDYPNTGNNENPFSTSIEIAPSPWNKSAQLLHIGIKGYTPRAPRPASNLVFLLDVSGSMSSPHKLPLLKSSLTLLAKQLNKNDRISIVVYAGAAGVVLEATRGDNQHKIINALNELEAGGSTNGGAGIKLAYQIAEENFIKEGINRILIATDGDFNVGTSSIKALKELVAKKRKKGISLTTLGFGQGNYNEALMEQIANIGNGNYAYIDSLKEANKVLVQQMKSTLITIAKDVKIQVEFNPNNVSQYRLIGYENRTLRNQDFANDKVDAGEIGAGHTVTALYEIILKTTDTGWVAPLRYNSNQNKAKKIQNLNNELAFLKIRYKHPKENKSQLLEWSLTKKMLTEELKYSSKNFRFSAAVAGFAQLLKNDEYLKNSFNFDSVLKLATSARGKDEFGYRGEFNQLVSLTKSLSQPIKTTLGGVD